MSTRGHARFWLPYTEEAITPPPSQTASSGRAESPCGDRATLTPRDPSGLVGCQNSLMAADLVVRRTPRPAAEYAEDVPLDQETHGGPTSGAISACDIVAAQRQNPEFAPHRHHDQPDESVGHPAGRNIAAELEEVGRVVRSPDPRPRHHVHQAVR